MKQNLVDETCELLQWSCNYRKLHNTATTEQYSSNIPSNSWPNQSSDMAKNLLQRVTEI